METQITWLTGPELAGALGLVSHFTASQGQGSWPSMSCVLAAADGQRLLLVSTDGVRTMQYVLPPGGDVSTPAGVIPKAVVAELVSLAQGVERVGVGIEPHSVSIYAGTDSRHFDLPLEPFPPYARAFTERFGFVEARRDGLLRALQSVGEPSVVLSSHSQGLQVVGPKLLQGAVIRFPCSGRFETRIDVGLLASTLQVLGAEDVRLLFGGREDALIVGVRDGRDLGATLMPMRWPADFN